MSTLACVPPDQRPSAPISGSPASASRSTPLRRRPRQHLCDVCTHGQPGGIVWPCYHPPASYQPELAAPYSTRLGYVVPPNKLFPGHEPPRRTKKRRFSDSWCQDRALSGGLFVRTPKSAHVGIRLMKRISLRLVFAICFGVGCIASQHPARGAILAGDGTPCYGVTFFQVWGELYTGTFRPLLSLDDLSSQFGAARDRAAEGRDHPQEPEGRRPTVKPSIQPVTPLEGACQSTSLSQSGSGGWTAVALAGLASRFSPETFAGRLPREGKLLLPHGPPFELLRPPQG